MNTMLSILGTTPAVASVVAASAAVPAVLVWSTVLVWMMVGLLLASVAAIVAGRTRPQSPGAHGERSGAGRRAFQVCAACAR